MPKEARERGKQSLRYGENGATTAEIVRVDSITSLVTESVPKTATDRPVSNGTHRRRSRTATQAMSAENSPERVPSNRSTGSRRVKDVISLHEQLSKARPEGSTVKENDNGRRPPSSATLPDRSPDLTSDEDSIPSQSELFEIPVATSRPRVTEIEEVPLSPSKDDPVLDYADIFSTAQLQKQLESKGAAFLDVRALEQNGLRRSSSLDTRSTTDRKSSPTTSSRRHSQRFSHSRPSSSSGSRRTERPESRSSNSAAAERRRSLGGNNGSNPNLNQEVPRHTSSSSRSARTTSRSSSGLGSMLSSSFRFSAGSNNAAKVFNKSSSPDIWQEEKSANAPMQPNARPHEGANGFKDEIDAADAGRLYTRQSASGSFRKSRAEDTSDPASGLRGGLPNPRSNSKQENDSHFSVTGQESNGSLTKDQTDSAHRHGKQGGPTGADLKQDSVFNNSGASTREDRSDSFRTLSEENDRSGTYDKYRNVRWVVKGVAAASYNGGWLPSEGMVPFPDDIANLNKFLNDSRNEVEAGVPGRFLTVVLGNENSDLDSIVSTIAYAYFLSSIGGKESKIYVPVINMRQEELELHTEAIWLFHVSGLDKSKLLFVDQISLQYYHRFGNLELVLVDHSRLAPHQETLQEAVIEIVDHNSTEELSYAWVPTKDIQQVGSCCTIIAERFAAEAPSHLAGRGLNRLLLGPILLDTANLDPKSGRCTSRDKCMAAFLIHGAGKYGRQGFFRLLRKMKLKSSTLSTIEMFRKEFSEWMLGPGKTNLYGLKGRVISTAMSSIGVCLQEVMAKKNILEDLKHFQRKMKLDLLVIVTGYNDQNNRYQRELLFASEHIRLAEHIRACFRPHQDDLQLSSILIPDLPKEMVAYKQGLVTASRTILRKILVNYFGM